MPSELLLSPRLPTLEGWTAELAAGLWLLVPTMGFEPTREDPTRTPLVGSCHPLVRCLMSHLFPRKSDSSLSTQK